MSKAKAACGRLLSGLRRMLLFPFLLPLFYIVHIERYYSGVVLLQDVVELTLMYTA